MAWGRRKNQTFQPTTSPDEASQPIPNASSPISASHSIPSSSASARDNERNENTDEEADSSSSPLSYPLFYVYENEEQALEEDIIRKRSKKSLASPPSPPWASPLS
jgi:hypothetical protein